MQSLFACTGCDYVLFSFGIGKSTFLKILFENAALSTRGDLEDPGTLANTDESQNMGHLSFLRLVACAYFKKHNPAFQGKSPSAHYNSFFNRTSTMEQHLQWFNSIRETICD